MWRVLPVCLLVACAVSEPKPPSEEGSEPSGGRIIRQMLLPLAGFESGIGDAPARRTFQERGTRGWLDQTGAWQIEAEIQHGRFLCATYETGVQLGRGDPACSNVTWLTEVEYATRLRHCNHASRLHRGGGEFSDSPDRLRQVTCVRVVVRCEGSC